MNKILAFLKNPKFLAVVSAILTALGGTAYAINSNAGPEALADNAMAINGMLGSGAIGSAIAVFLGSGKAAPTQSQIDQADLQAICHIRTRALSVGDPTTRQQMLAACDGLTGALFRLSEQETISATTK